jgi:UDP-glucuronate 4-epimerase
MGQQTILLTGGAGFIGSHVAERLLEIGHIVYCMDNLDPFYDPALKMKNIISCQKSPNFHFIKADFSLVSKSYWEENFNSISFHVIIHLGAKAGVRASIDQAYNYYETNLSGTIALLDFAREAGIPKFIFASSSSVYGNEPNVPWSEENRTCDPISPYAASKLAAEQIGRIYAGLFNFQFISLRLFTVYGPRQRPDLAIHKFYDQIVEGSPLVLYGNARSRRDYTHVSDIVTGILAAMEYSGKENIFNLGDSRPVELIEMIHILECKLKKKASIILGPDQEGDVKQTFANIDKAHALLGYLPKIGIEDGIEEFVKWKREIH